MASYIKKVCFEYVYLFTGLFYLINFNLIEQACETDPVQNRNGIKSGYRIAMIFR